MELTLFSPAGDGSRRYILANGETIIGRRPDCRIVLDAPSISARHARLFTVDGHAVIHGIDEAWPVYVNGEPVKRRVLAAGDDIELGPYRLRYTDGGITETVDSELQTAPEPAPETAPGPMENGPADPPEPPDPDTGDPAVTPAHASPSGEERVADAPAVAQPAEPIAAAPPEVEPVEPSSPGMEPETAEAVDREHADAEWGMPDRADTIPAPADSLQPDFEDTRNTDPEPVEPDPALPAEDRPAGTEEAPPAMDDAAPASDDDAPQETPEEVESERAGGFHLDILTGINRGRRVSLTNDLVVLGFNRQPLVEIRNHDGALSLRRLDDDAAAELNGEAITAEPGEAQADDIITLQRIEMRIHRDRP
ncbi:MAG: FHA domain-containing protein [Gammaproteobacteria bacterium]|nr:FHA domain-containing protein [Gammaproteobacteria bacterium]